LQLRATCLFAVVLIAAVFAALSSDIEGADAEPPPRVGEISVYVFTPNDPERHALELHVFPEQGVAVLKTLMSDERGINYAIAIPKRQFEGSLDLDFPHLGRIVGNVVVAPGQEACGEDGGEDANFRGQLSFRGVGSHERWSATKAYAALRDTCQVIEPPRGKGDVLLTNAVAREGPGFSGPDFIAFFARSFTRRRYLEFVAVSRDLGGPATFLATDVEFLPGRVAAERWIDRFGVEADRTLSVEGEAQMPSGATFMPPAPFFGKGVYDPRTKKLTGSLGVRFPGLTLRLAHPPMEGSLTDEEPR
jgi:hypothetical protein